MKKKLFTRSLSGLKVMMHSIPFNFRRHDESSDPLAEESNSHEESHVEDAVDFRYDHSFWCSDENDPWWREPAPGPSELSLPLNICDFMGSKPHFPYIKPGVRVYSHQEAILEAMNHLESHQIFHVEGAPCRTRTSVHIFEAGVGSGKTLPSIALALSPVVKETFYNHTNTIYGQFDYGDEGLGGTSKRTFLPVTLVVSTAAIISTVWCAQMKSFFDIPPRRVLVMTQNSNFQWNLEDLIFKLKPRVVLLVDTKINILEKQGFFKKYAFQRVILDDYQDTLCGYTGYHLNPRSRSRPGRVFLISQLDRVMQYLGEELINGLGRRIWIISATISNLMVKHGSSSDEFQKLFFDVTSDRYFRHLILRVSEEVIRDSINLPPPRETHLSVVQSFNSSIAYLIANNLQALVDGENYIKAMRNLGWSGELVKANFIDAIIWNLEHEIGVMKKSTQTALQQERIKIKEVILAEVKRRQRMLAEGLNQDCCICCVPMSNFPCIVFTKCNHTLCNLCFFRWHQVNKTCPVCRTVINADDYNVIGTASTSISVFPEETNSESITLETMKTGTYMSRMDAIEKLAQADTYNIKYGHPLIMGRRVVIFHNVDDRMEDTQNMLNRNGYKVYIFSKIPKCSLQKTIEAFRLCQGREVFLISSSSAVAGINLSFADTCIINNQMPNIDQAIGRLQRPGRTTILNVIYMTNA